MTKRAGRDMRTSVSSDGITWYTLSTQTDSVAFAAESVDVSDNGDNPWRTTLAECGILGTVINCAGFITGTSDGATAYDLCQAALLARSTIRARIVSVGDSVVSVVADGAFRVASVERSAEYNGAERFSLSMPLTGALSAYVLPPIPDPPPVTALGHSICLSTRLLRVEYAGACMRVRRSSDNAELDIGFLTGGLMDVASLLAFVGTSDGLVVRWYNQTPQFALQYLEQLSAPNQPYIVQGGVLETVTGDTIPWIFFDRTHWLQAPTITDVPRFSALGVCSGSMVIRTLQNWNNGARSVIAQMHTGGGNANSMITNNVGEVELTVGTIGYTEGIDFRSWHWTNRKLSMVYRGAVPGVSRSWSDVATVIDTTITSTPGTDGLDAFKIGTGRYPPGGGMTGHIAEMVFMSELWTDAQALAVATEATAYYSTTIETVDADFRNRYEDLTDRTYEDGQTVATEAARLLS
jgi:predicted secreted protein